MKNSYITQRFPIPLGFETEVRLPADHAELGVTVVYDSGVERLALVCLVPDVPEDYVTISLYCVPEGVFFDPHFHAVGDMYPGIYVVNGVVHTIWERIKVIM